jgi:proline racemase
MTVRIQGRAEVDGAAAIVPEISADVWSTGESTFWADR